MCSQALSPVGEGYLGSNGGGIGVLGLALSCRWLPAWPPAVPGPLQASVGAEQEDGLSPEGYGSYRGCKQESGRQEDLDRRGEEGSEEVGTEAGRPAWSWRERAGSEGGSGGRGRRDVW